MSGGGGAGKADGWADSGEAASSRKNRKARMVFRFQDSISMPVRRQPTLARGAVRVKQSVSVGTPTNMETKLFSVPLLALVALLIAGPVTAAEPVVVRDAWIRAPVPGQPIAGAYMELTAGAKSALV